MIANIDARMALVTNIIMNPSTYILTVNKNKKIVRWEGIWNNNNESVLKALTIVQKLRMIKLSLLVRKERHSLPNISRQSPMGS
eukprot:scaffold5752_cov54-Cyclotella_meneghiniana.AAC.3